MNTENDIKEFGFRHISINTVYNVIYNRTLWCRSYTSITAPHELSSVSRGLGIFALWALDT